jgi:succinate dehydrogenase hydrophobic anchor subunit
MGKGNRNRETRGIEYVNVSPKQKKAPKHKKPMPAWLKKAITIAVVVVLVLGIVAAILASNGTFKRWQVLVKSKTGEFTVNRQVATFLA